MNQIEEQRQLIDKIYRLVRNSLNDEFDTAHCWFEYFVSEEDGSTSIGTQLSYDKNGETKYGQLLYPDDAILYEIVPQLHEKMKAHTGGNWQVFTLTINKDGSVEAKFQYRGSTTSF